MSVKSVVVKKREVTETLEIEIEIRGGGGAGKTVIAAMLQESLEFAGFRNVSVISADGDVAKTRKRLPRIDFRDQRCLNTEIRILDENKPVVKQKTIFTKLIDKLKGE